MLATQAAEMPDWPLPPPKTFKPKYQLPLIEDYKTEAPAEFWEIFPDREPGAGHSLVSEQKLREAQMEAKLEAGPVFEAVCRDIREGADIGCRGQFREQSGSSNAPSAFEYAHLH
jgi:hypothetical protein